jgi:tRNA dimethylallyltransferase
MDLICIVGPTAVGKTKLSIEVAKAFNGEIISGDAFQFYKGMDIGTAKATSYEQGQVTHHLLDILELSEEFSVVDFQRLVRQTIEEIKDRGHLPIVVGGSGLYIQSIIKDYQFKGNKRQDQYDEQMSLEDLQKRLKEKNPTLYDRIDLDNRRRVIRALEKEDKDIQDHPKDYYDQVFIIGLYTDREQLYQRINQRVLDMIDRGLIQEANNLYQNHMNSQAAQAIGYKELFPYFSKQTSLEDAIHLIQRNSRRYAKRQMTWFRNKMDVHWFESHLDDFDQTTQKVIQAIKKAQHKEGL